MTKQSLVYWLVDRTGHQGVLGTRLRRRQLMAKTPTWGFPRAVWLGWGPVSQPGEIRNQCRVRVHAFACTCTHAMRSYPTRVESAWRDSTRLGQARYAYLWSTSAPINSESTWFSSHQGHRIWIRSRKSGTISNWRWHQSW